MDQWALLGERVARQGLHDGIARTVAQAAALTCAIQAQDPPASRLGLRVRGPGLVDADVLDAIATSRTVVRTWLMRGTIHLVDTADLRWLVRLFGPAVIGKYRTRWRQLGLTDEVLAAVLRTLPEVLAGGPLTRAEIKDAFDERGLVLGMQDRQVHTHALMHASCLGLVCRGADRGRTATFALLDSWVPAAPDGPSGQDALAELARRYFAAFSPATAADFSTWAGLPSTAAVTAIRDELEPVDVDGRPGYRLGSADPVRGVRLLPAFDNYLLGYRDRGAILAARLRGRVYEGGMIRAAVLCDGRVVGTWSVVGGIVVMTPFERLVRAVVTAVEAEVDDLARFLARALSLETAPVAP